MLDIIKFTNCAKDLRLASRQLNLLATQLNKAADESIDVDPEAVMHNISGAMKLCTDVTLELNPELRKFWNAIDDSVAKTSAKIMRPKVPWYKRILPSKYFMGTVAYDAAAHKAYVTADNGKHMPKDVLKKFLKLAKLPEDTQVEYTN